MQEAADPTVPLFERMKFLGIFSSNLDEFFRVRVATVKRILGAGKKAIANLGTGNYNEETAKVYSDHSFFTADRRITDEVKQIFTFLEKNYKTGSYQHLVVSPFYMRKKIGKLIDNEIKNAKARLLYPAGNFYKHTLEPGSLRAQTAIYEFLITQVAP